MLTFDELTDGEGVIPRRCRYPVTDEPPHFFCGEATDGRSYCPEHDALCHDGHGKPWQALAGMMEAVEQTIIPTPKRAADVQPPLDEALSSTRIDRSLMERL